MSSATMTIAAGVVASLFLGTISNYLYDLLRGKGFFPNRPSLKAIVIIILSILPFIFIVVMPSGSPLWF